MIGFFVTQLYINKNKINADLDFLISKTDCEKLNTFREHISGSYVYDVVNTGKNMIDFRSERKYNSFHVEDTVNVPIWKLILDANNDKNIFMNNETSFVCYINESDSWGNSHKVCYSYLPSFLFLLFNKTYTKTSVLPTDTGQFNEWVYYDINHKLSNIDNYIVFYPEMNLSGYTVLELDNLENSTYLNTKIDVNKIYHILCTNDFSCLHSWAVKEFLITKGYSNINKIVKQLGNLKKKSNSGNGTNYVDLRIKKGKYNISKDIRVRNGTKLIIDPGTVFNIGKGKKIIVNGKIIANGTKDQPIIFRGDDWEGIVINGTDQGPDIVNLTWQEFENVNNRFGQDFFNKLDQGNIFNHVVFENVSYEQTEEATEFNHRAVIEAHNTSVVVANSIFRDVTNFGAMQIKNSYSGLFNNSLLINVANDILHSSSSQVVIHKQRTDLNTHNQGNNGLWVQDSLTIISSNSVTKKGDDGMDIEGGYSYVLNNILKENKDEGIDAGDISPSKYFIYNNFIANNSGRGILLSSTDAIVVNNTILANTLSGLSLRNKASAYAVNNIIKHNNQGISLYFLTEKRHTTPDEDTSNLTNEQYLELLKEINKNRLLLTNCVISDNNYPGSYDESSLVDIDNCIIQGEFQSNADLNSEFQEMVNVKYVNMVNNINKIILLFEHQVNS